MALTKKERDSLIHETASAITLLADRNLTIHDRGDAAGTTVVVEFPCNTDTGGREGQVLALLQERLAEKLDDPDVSVAHSLRPGGKPACGMCGKMGSEVEHLRIGLYANICDRCIERSAAELEEIRQLSDDSLRARE